MTVAEALSPTIDCPKCDGTGERPDKPPPGQKWSEPDCTRCRGTGQVDRGHYAYCKDPECVGCRPSVAEIERLEILPLWGEMLARCISQTPQTKTRDGAIAAIRADDLSYATVAHFARQSSMWQIIAQRLADGWKIGPAVRQGTIEAKPGHWVRIVRRGPVDEQWPEIDEAEPMPPIIAKLAGDVDVDAHWYPG